MQSLSIDLLPDSQAQRQTMVDCQIRTFDVTDQRLIARVLHVPRELFVPDNVRRLAYSDIGFVMPARDFADESRYLLPPLVLVRMLQGAGLKPTDRVLDVAPGGGYSTAIITGLVGHVTGLEGEEAQRADAEARLAAFGLGATPIKAGPLAAGFAGAAPFDVIFVNGAVQTLPEELFAQLAEGGRLVAIKRDANDSTGRASKAMRYEKHGGAMSGRYLFDATAPCLRAFRDAPQFVF